MSGAGLSRDDVVAWLTRLGQTLDRDLAGAERERVLAELRRDADTTRANLQALLVLALLDDCLHVIHLAAEADGVVDPDELARVAPLLVAAATRYACLRPGYEPFGELDGGDLLAFLRMHRSDERPFGHGHAGSWRGLALCRRAARAAGNATLLEDYEGMLVRVMDVVFAGRATAAEHRARRRLRELLAEAPAAGVDRRAEVFCRADAPEVFSSVAYGSQVFEADPYDVPGIHAEARAAFERQVDRATTPALHGIEHGHLLLVLGPAGSGKTHLLRALRSQLHGQRLGYAGYLQMAAGVADPGRYVLANLVDSLERPYAPELRESGLLYLSDGLAETTGALAPDELERLRSGDLDGPALTSFIGGLVDRVVRTERLARVDSDLVQALLLLQRRDPAIQRRVVKYLRCEPLTAHEQALLGGLAPRLRAEDAARLVAQLGALMFELQEAALVLLVDQVEDAGGHEGGPAAFQAAIDVLRRIADAVPSAVVVVACLDDVYEHLKVRLTQSARDRLERDPAPLRLASQRRRDEVEALLARRLEHLYEARGVAWREEEPLYPFAPAQVDRVVNQAARECLASFRRYHDACIGAGRLVEPGEGPVVLAPPLLPFASVDYDALLDARVAAAPASPDEDEALLELVERVLRASAAELPGVGFRTERRGERLWVVADGGRPLGPRVIAVCNRQAQGSHGLATQIEELAGATPAGHVPVALRCSDFTFGPRARVTQKLGAFIHAGGVTLTVEGAELRAAHGLLALVSERPGDPGLEAWRMHRRPLAGLACVRGLLGVEPTPAAAAVAPGAPASASASGSAPSSAAPPVPAPPSAPAAPAPVRPVSAGRASASQAPVGSAILLGTAATLRAEPVALEREQVKQHAAFLGSTGSGKTSLALHVIEQLLEQGVSALLVDRKGDLARYADPAWWAELPADPEAARRKAALRERLQVQLFTPGDPAGLPLRLPVIPSGMAAMTSHERDQVAKIAAAGLAAMMQYGKAEAHRRREAILKKAIELHASAGGASLDELRETVARPDPALLAEVGSLSRHFGPLAEDLDSLAIQRGNLLGGDGDVLDVDRLLGGPPTRLSIISTHALVDDAVLQFWVSRLLVDLARWLRGRPSAALQAVVFLDEADRYIPALSAPPTKEPLFDLLRRARSGGLGVLLASQNPGDFDYRARDLVHTWLVGKITQERATDKMRSLLGDYPNVGPRLAGQGVGAFFLLGTPPARELRGGRPLLVTEQLAVAEIAALARRRMA